ncbi:lycopene cyclase domain-containing protein [Niastella caeni]|uniref:Lycopene cyclase domain-containing protein n=1 Tax=Niastella caeni TaxID=2569763 RepID=A0A4S8HRW8_9BACT|nr:lycopene cyclase domain-containing protein [Niastella caeni]THU38268.1 lycopene cyclase domain-containing protein [Niastella caeni]
MHATYLLINFFSVIVPFLFSFHPALRFYIHFKAFLAGNFITTACFIAWDMLFTCQKVWGFNDTYTLGYKLYNLPVEEVLFFICIPFACVFTYHCLTTFYKISWPHRPEKIVILVLSLLLLSAGMVYLNRLYSAVTFISTGVLLLTLKFVCKVNWLPRFLTIYPLLLIPFFIVNGLLTGTGLQQPVVWYNNAETVGIRVLTIPVEDFVYGLELLLVNLFFYERFKPVFKVTASRFF